MYQYAATCSVTLKYTASSMRFTLPTDVDKLYHVLFVHVFYTIIIIHFWSWARDNTVATTRPCFQATTLFFYCNITLFCVATAKYFSNFFWFLRLYYLVVKLYICHVASSVHIRPFCVSQSKKSSCKLSGRKPTCILFTHFSHISNRYFSYYELFLHIFVPNYVKLCSIKSLCKFMLLLFTLQFMHKTSYKY